MKKLLLGAVAMLAVLPASARADTFQADTFSLVPGDQAVAITSPVGETVLAGQVKLSGPGGDLLVWCLDLIDHLNVPYTYQVNTYNAGDIRPGMQVLDGSQLRQIASADGVRYDGQPRWRFGRGCPVGDLEDRVR